MIICGHCGDRHPTVDTVRDCHRGDVFPCSWLVPAGRTEDGEARIIECRAAATLAADGREWVCEAGHGHVSAQARAEQGWEYADEQEAGERARYGYESRLMDGHLYVGR